MKPIVTIHMQSEVKNESLEGQSFIGTMLGGDSCQTMCVGKLGRAKVLDITAANLAAYLTIGRDRQVNPKELLDDLVKIQVVAMQKTVDQMKETSPDGNMTDYDLQFMLEALKVIVGAIVPE